MLEERRHPSRKVFQSGEVLDRLGVLEEVLPATAPRSTEFLVKVASGLERAHLRDHGVREVFLEVLSGDLVPVRIDSGPIRRTVVGIGRCAKARSADSTLQNAAKHRARLPQRSRHLATRNFGHASARPAFRRDTRLRHERIPELKREISTAGSNGNRYGTTLSEFS